MNIIPMFLSRIQEQKEYHALRNVIRPVRTRLKPLNAYIF